MKQKYIISKDQKTYQIKIQEFAELDKDIFSLVCEEAYEGDKIKAGVSEGKEALIEILRTPNLYPVAEYADKIADSVENLFNKTDETSVEIAFDDIEALKKESTASNNKDDDESVAIDDLLNNNLDAGEQEGEEEEEATADTDKNNDTANNAPEIDEDALDLFDDEDDDMDKKNSE